MTECVYQLPHRYDGNLGPYGNLVGETLSPADWPYGVCESGFLAGMGFGSALLLAGAIVFGALWSRAPRWSAVMFAASFVYWAMVKFAALNVLFDSYGNAPETHGIRQHWAEAAASQAAFEFLVLALIPIAVIRWVFSRFSGGAFRSGGKKVQV